MEQSEMKDMWKPILRMALSLLMLFLFVYMISRAWKKGQANG